ncbi:MAG: tRNA (adenosine(37)-N6)-dimethylallyltransferase MiaA [Patescibacteria group bacterium]|nr:tRNA (adenosine(37)-N6)-dimethylallyltransferase MiaA [Patescibacteria group bacterium]
MQNLKKNTKNNKVVAIIGPTGSGKTAWAKKIAAKFQAKIISVDSRQIYKGFDIGTGKDKSFHQDLIDIAEPTKRFTLWDYQNLANDLISQYFQMKSLPVLVGGTGLYLYAVLYGYVLPNIQEESEKFRKKLEKENITKLYEELKKIDLRAALKIDPQNKRRIIRALEVAALTRRPSDELVKKKKLPFKTLIIGIKTDRETLYSKIDARIDQMIKDGLVEEVRVLLKKYPPDLTTLNTIGYKEIIDYLQGHSTLKEAILKIKTNTHAYVRRQETWFRKNKDIKWVEKYEDAEKLIVKFLKN